MTVTLEGDDQLLALVIKHQLQIFPLKGAKWRVSGKPRRYYKVYVSATSRDLRAAITACVEKIRSYVHKAEPELTRPHGPKVIVTDEMLRRYGFNV